MAATEPPAACRVESCLHTPETVVTSGVSDKGQALQLSLLANYCQREQLKDNYAALEMTALAPCAPPVK